MASFLYISKPLNPLPLKAWDPNYNPTEQGVILGDGRKLGIIDGKMESRGVSLEIERMNTRTPMVNNFVYHV